jgi:hypothetical protein
MLIRSRLPQAPAIHRGRTGVIGVLPSPPRRRVRQMVLMASASLFAISLVSGLNSTAALFTNSQGSVNTVGTKRIFPGEHVTSGFDVRDASGGGSEVNRSSPYAVAGDGRTSATKAWAAGFATDRYLQYDMSDPLPGGLAVASPAFRFTFASAGAGAMSCVYFEVRQISTNAVIGTYGSAGSPAGCVTGTSSTTLAQAIGAVGSTDLANDLRVRVYASNSASGGMVIDEARFTGATPYVSFSTYPVRGTDAADTLTLTTPWDLQGP